MKIGHTTILMLITFTVSLSRAYDCSGVKPFKPSGNIKVNAYVSKFVWQNGIPNYEDICVVSNKIYWYDVRGREEAAYYCLKPPTEQILICKTEFENVEAEIRIYPASWIRNWMPSPVREYRFHAYITKTKDPNFYYDIFSRVLSDKLKLKSTALEGSLRTGPSNPSDGFWLRLEFK